MSKIWKISERRGEKVSDATKGSSHQDYSSSNVPEAASNYLMFIGMRIIRSKVQPLAHHI